MGARCKVWQMLGYDGVSFRLSKEIAVLFPTMGEDKNGWLNDCSVLYSGLRLHSVERGGIAEA